MNFLDLRSDGELSSNEAKLITKLEPKVRNEYNDYIGLLIKENKIVNLSWLTRVTCRNTRISDILDQFCRLVLFDELCKRGNCYPIVKVDDETLVELILKIAEKYNQHPDVITTHNNFNGIAAVFKNLFKSCFVILNSYIWPKIIRVNSRPNNEIILIDSFVLIESFNDKAEFKDRYYPGILDHIDTKVKNKVWFSLLLIGLKYPNHYYRILKLIRKSTVQIIIKEDWLKIRDYISALVLSYQLPKNIKIIPKWRGLDVSNIVTKEVKKDIFSTDLLNSLLMYKYIKRLADKKIKLTLVIDWFENQVIDRALNIAIKKYYPKVYVKGYQGFVIDDYYACQQPTQYEYSANTLPDEICVIGKAYISHRKALCKELRIRVAPALRSTHVYKAQKRRPDKQTILLVLPLSLVGARTIIRMCLGVNDIEGLKYIVKQHPVYSKEIFCKLVPDANDKRFSFTDKSVLELFESAALLLSNSSSVCLEAICAGVPLVVAGSRCGPTMNPVKSYINNEKFILCYDSDCLSKSIRNIVSTKDTSAIQVEDYFEKVNADTIANFLTVND